MKSNETRIWQSWSLNYLSFQVIIRVGNCTHFSFDDDTGHIFIPFSKNFSQLITTLTKNSMYNKKTFLVENPGETSVLVLYEEKNLPPKNTQN